MTEPYPRATNMWIEIHTSHIRSHVGSTHETHFFEEMSNALGHRQTYRFY